VFTSKQQELIDQPLVANIAIPNEQGYPHITPVWLVGYKDHLYFSTMDDRAKIKHLSNGKKIGVSIVHPSGAPYVSMYAQARIWRRGDFDDYDAIISRIVGDYVEDEDKRVEFKQNLLTNDHRVLVEINPIHIYPSSE
jgi:hypothetical protein